MDEIREIMARANAEFDGRPFDQLGRAERTRYLDRAGNSLSALSAAGYVVVDKAELQKLRDRNNPTKILGDQSRAVSLPGMIYVCPSKDIICCRPFCADCKDPRAVTSLGYSTPGEKQ